MILLSDNGMVGLGYPLTIKVGKFSETHISNVYRDKDLKFDSVLDNAKIYVLTKFFLNILFHSRVINFCVIYHFTSR